MLSKTYENMPLSVRRSLALAIAAVALPSCGGNTNETEMPAAAQPKSTPVEVQPNTAPVETQPTPVTTTETEVTKEIEGGPEGFPLEAEIKHEGSTFQFIVSNVNEEAAGRFKVYISAIGKDGLPVEPLSVDAEGLEVNTLKLPVDSPEQKEGPFLQILAPGLEAGDTLTIEAEFPDVRSVYQLIEPSVPGAEHRWSDKVYTVEGSQ